MNCYSAHLSIDVHCSLRKKKKTIFYSTGPHCFYFLFILSNPVIHSLSFSLSLSFISHSSQAPLSQRRRHHQAHSGTVQLASFFFLFFHFIKSGLIHCHLSSQASQAHSLNIAGPVSLSQLRSPTHEARHRSECLTGKPMELAIDQSACLWILVLSCR